MANVSIPFSCRRHVLTYHERFEGSLVVLPLATPAPAVYQETTIISDSSGGRQIVNLAVHSGMTVFGVHALLIQSLANFTCCLLP